MYGLSLAHLPNGKGILSRRFFVMTTVGIVALMAGATLSSADTARADDAQTVAVPPAQSNTAVQLAQAGTATQAAPSSPESLESVVITGTRIVRDGYDQPTPVTVVGLEEIQQLSPTNLADYINTLPELAGSATPQSSRTSVSAGGAGLNNLNLRDLGTTRTLILIDGMRSVGSQSTGIVDINTIPQELVSRVDIVTGGASAQYGSDAVAGVVNFILDKNYTGLKGQIQGGVTTYGDDPSVLASLTAGTGFDDDRGHIIFNFEDERNAGINGVPRDWAQTGTHIILNPAYKVGNGQPFQLVLPQTSQDNQTPGGIITAGPLKGTAFGPGGTVYQFAYGSLVQDPWMQGGQWAANDVTSSAPNSYGGYDDSLDPSETRQSAYMRLSYNVTSNIEIYGSLNWNYDNSTGIASGNFDPGDITLSASNAYLPASVAAKAQALGLTTLQIGTMSGDLPPLTANNRRTLTRYNIGANGDFDVFGSNWTWNTFYQNGYSIAVKRFLDRNKANLTLAEQAVINPATGAPTCASTLTNPNNGCVPFDFFGTGVNSQAAINYLSFWSYEHETYGEEEMSASIQGEPFSIWAGPVSIATGVEHRMEDGGGTQSALNAANDSFVGDQAPIIGEYNVTEGFLETVVPLAKNYSWADSLDFNGAMRFTSYSTSGFVATWKAGLTYQPFEDVRLRATQSRDIRAPNRDELFAAGIYTGNLVNDPFHNNTPVNVQSLQIGNLNLKPEAADTTTVGVVATPHFLPGLQASVDYFGVHIHNAIGTVSRQNVPNLCYAGVTSYCSALTFNPVTGYLSQVIIQPTNFVVQVAEGVDYELDYNFSPNDILPILNGDVRLRALATQNITNFTNSGLGGTSQLVNALAGSGEARWKYTLSATWTKDPYIVNLSARGFSSGVYSNSTIGCTSGCPLDTATTLTQNINYLPGAIYFDAAFTYRLKPIEGVASELFVTVRNIANKDPAIVAQGTSGVAFSTPPCNAVIYDCLGRMYHAGFRFSM